MRQKTVDVICERCGNLQPIVGHEAHHVRIEDYLELWHAVAVEIQQLRRERDEALDDLARLRFLVSVLEVPTPEQIEVRNLRGILAATFADEPETAAA